MDKRKFKEQCKEVEKHPYMVKTKKVYRSILALFVVMAIVFLFVLPPISMVFFIVAIVYEIIYKFTYRFLVKNAVKHPEVLRGKTYAKKIDVQKRNPKQQMKNNVGGNVITDTIVSYGIGKAILNQQKQTEAVKYGANVIGCEIVSQNGRDIKYRLKCSKCGALAKGVKTMHLNPNQKRCETTKCAECKQYFTTTLLLVKR